MTALIIIASIILVIAFLLTRYAGVIVRYNDDFSLTVTYGILKFHPGKRSRPRKAKKKKKKSKKKNAPSPPPSEPTEEDAEFKRAKRREKRKVIIELAKKIKEILPGFLGKIHFKSAKLFAKIATGDAASTAIACGGAKAAASLIFETIDNFAILDRGSEKNVLIEPDFISDEPWYDIDLRFRIRVIYAVRYGLHVLKEFIKLKIKQENKTVRK